MTVSDPGAGQQQGRCKSCGKAYSPIHDSSAPGPTVRHPFFPVRSGRRMPTAHGLRHDPACAFDQWREQQNPMPVPPDRPGPSTPACTCDALNPAPSPTPPARDSDVARCGCGRAIPCRHCDERDSGRECDDFCTLAGHAHCTSVGCDVPGTVWGIYDDGDTRERVLYCTGCAKLLADGGEFTPDAADVNTAAESSRGRDEAADDELARSLSPTQELVLDVLAARLRLGDTLWTFTTKVRPAVRALAALGLVSEMHGITDHTVRASLTEQGRALWMLPDSGRDEAREAVARWLWRQEEGALRVDRSWNEPGFRDLRRHFQRKADELLALPELDKLLRRPS